MALTANKFIQTNGPPATGEQITQSTTWGESGTGELNNGVIEFPKIAGSLNDLLTQNAAGVIGYVTRAGIDTTAFHNDVSSEISIVSEKLLPISGDFLLLEDSASGNSKKRIQVGNLPFPVSPVTSVAGKTGVVTLQEADITDLSHFDSAAIHDNVSAEISIISEKLTPISGDFLLLEDSASGNVKKRVQVGNLPSVAAPVDSVAGKIGVVTLQEADITDLSHTDTLAIHSSTSGEISIITEKLIPINGDFILIEDSAAANVKKRIQIGNLPGGGGGSSSGISGSVQFSDGLGGFLSDAPNFFFDNTSDSLSIGHGTPLTKLHIEGLETAIIRLENPNTVINAGDLIGSLEFFTADPSTLGAGIHGAIRVNYGITDVGSVMHFHSTTTTTLDEEFMRVEKGNGVTLNQSGIDGASFSILSGPSANGAGSFGVNVTSGFTNIGSGTPVSLLDLRDAIAAPILTLSNTSLGGTDKLLSGIEFRTSDLGAPGAGVVGAIRMQYEPGSDSGSAMRFYGTDGSSTLDVLHMEIGREGAFILNATALDTGDFTVLADTTGTALKVTASTALVDVAKGDLNISATGKGLGVKSGAVTDSVGAATLAAGTVTIANTNIKTGDIIIWSRFTNGGTLGDISYTIIDSTSFTFTSTSGTETSVLDYMIVRTI